MKKNYVAKAVRSPLYRHQIVESIKGKGSYKKESKHQKFKLLKLIKSAHYDY